MSPVSAIPFVKNRDLVGDPATAAGDHDHQGRVPRTYQADPHLPGLQRPAMRRPPATHTHEPRLRRSAAVESLSFAQVEAHKPWAAMPAVFRVGRAPPESCAAQAFARMSAALASPAAACSLWPSLKLAKVFQEQGGLLVKATDLKSMEQQLVPNTSLLPTTLQSTLNTVNLWNFGALPGELRPRGAVYHVDRTKRPTVADFDSTVLMAIHKPRHIFLYEPAAFSRARAFAKEAGIYLPTSQALRERFGDHDLVPMRDMEAMECWYKDSYESLVAAGYGPTYEVLLQPGEILVFQHRLVHATLDQADDWAVVLTFYRAAAAYLEAGQWGRAQAKRCKEVAALYDLQRRARASNLLPAEITQQLIDQLPWDGDAESVEDLLAQVVDKFSQYFGTAMTQKCPTTPSWASEVSLLIDALGSARAVVKIYHAPFDGLLRELSAIRHLNRLGMSDLAYLSVGRALVAGEAITYLVTNAVGTTDLESVLTQSQDVRLVEQAGCATALLHAHIPPSENVVAIKEERNAHLAYVRRLVDPPDNVVEALVHRGWLSRELAIPMATRIRQIIDGYAKSPLITPSLGSPHGDCYAANFVADAKDAKMIPVDLESMVWSQDPTAHGGIGDVRQDPGRFTEALLLQGQRERFPEATTAALQAAFWRGLLKSKEGEAASSLQEHAEFFRLRYDTVVLQAALRGQIRKATLENVRTFWERIVDRLMAVTQQPDASAN